MAGGMGLIVFGVYCLSSVMTVPILSEHPSNKLDDLEDVETIETLEDDFTTRSLERLSSAATCLVAGIEYTHGQQINRMDPCEFCLCLDGEMFCWWQDCPPATDGPCKDQGPFSQCDNVVVTKRPKDIQEKSFLNNTSTNKNISGEFSLKNVSTETPSRNISFTKVSTRTSSIARPEASTKLNSETSIPNESSTVAVTSVPKFCIVMGIEYRIGDKLPHDTGNCIECICGEGAKISCSPHQCAPLGEEINDYRPPEPRLTNSDSF